MASESDSRGERATSPNGRSTALTLREEFSAGSGKERAMTEESDEQPWREVRKGKWRKGGRALKSKFFRFGESALQIDETRDLRNGKPYRGMKLLTMKGDKRSYIRVPTGIASDFLHILEALNREGSGSIGRELWSFGWDEIRGAMEFVLGRSPIYEDKERESPQPLALNLPSARNPAKEEILFSHAAWDKGAASLRRSVVLKAEGEWEALPLVIERIDKWWPLSHDPQVSYLARNTWLLWIEDVAEQAQVLEKGHKASMKCYPYEKWRQQSREGRSATWVRLQGLPLELWSQTFLESIFRGMGDLLRLDEAIVTARQLDYAQALIRLKYPIEAEESRIVRVGTKTFSLVFTEEKGGDAARVVAEAEGTAGGILMVWDSNLLEMEEEERAQYFIGVKFKDKENATTWSLGGVYGPSSYQERQSFWEELGDLLSRWPVPWLLAGDFNGIRFRAEKSPPLSRINATMRSFNDFIGAWELEEIPTSGKRFTRSNGRSNPTPCRLDRFLASESWLHLFRDATGTVVGKVVSDHWPKSLDTKTCSWGRKSFKFESWWLQNEQLVPLMKEW
ncbi:hypothetical protein H6P81_012849 [Aristolochia fimbriata]|uniref:Endonuclease/exonuclease/phosphatase domain-containing protein n=1 Tax=Aristolochia fimbriata TaxID=158543 RepID=A0AAV7EE88_ARIFI|nr:hypothetical protein H6P81_012849 [Aristolochia fimbriata]